MLQVMLSTQRRCRAPVAVTRFLPGLAVAFCLPAFPLKLHRAPGPTIDPAVGPAAVSVVNWCQRRGRPSASAPTALLLSIPPLPPAPSQAVPVAVMAKVAQWPWIVDRNATGPLLIRTHYDELYKLVDRCLADTSTSFHNLLLTGNPGIGKSLGALNYLLLRTLTAQPNVVVVTIDLGHVEVFRVDKKQQSKAHRQRFPLKFVEAALDAAQTHLESLRLPTTTKLLLLHDQKGGSLPFHQGFHDRLCLLFRVTCVLAASPKEDNYRNFLKCTPSRDLLAGAAADAVFGVSQFILPLWSKDETKIFVDVEIPMFAPRFDDEFKVRGGVLRNWGKEMANVIADQDVAFSMERLTLSAVMGRSLRIQTSSKLLGMVPSDNYRNVQRMQFVSQRVTTMAYQADARVTLEEARTRYEEAMAKFSQDVVGRLFESVALKTVAAGWPLSVARLSAPGTTPPAPKRLGVAPFGPLAPWTPLSPVNYGTALGNIAAAEQLFIPIDDSFSFTDAILVRNGEATLLQTTGSSKHTPTEQSWKDIVQFIGSSASIKNIVWMVPMTSAWRQFGYQRLSPQNADYDKITQYVCPVYSSLSEVLFVRGPSNTNVELLAIPRSTDGTVASTCPTVSDYAAAVSMYVTGTTSVLVDKQMVCGYPVGIYTASAAPPTAATAPGSSAAPPTAPASSTVAASCR